jgi:hypothetical protein
MDNQVKTYKFSPAEVVQYISQNIEVSNNVVKIIKKVTKVDDKTINKISIVNDIMSKVGDLVITIKDKLNINSKALKSIKVSISNITEILSLLLDNIIFKIISISAWASLSLPSLIVVRIYTALLYRFVSKLFDSFGIIANFKVSILNNSFDKISNIIDNSIYISKKLSILGAQSLIAIPLIKPARRYIFHLGKFMRTLYWAFSLKQTIKISVLKIFFDALNVVSDLILSVTGKLMKLGAISLIARWVLKPATKYITQLHTFNSLILNLFRKRDIISMLIMEKYFEVLKDVIVNIISVSNSLIKLRFIVRIANRFLERRILNYIFNLSRLCSMLTNLFKNQGIIKLKMLHIKFKILENIFEVISDIAGKIIKIGILSIITIPLMVFVRIFIKQIRSLINLLRRAFIVRSLVLIKIKTKIMLLNSIIRSLITFSLNIIILSVIAIFAIPALLLSTLYVLMITAFVVVLKVLLRVARIKLRDILAMAVLIIAIGLLIAISAEVLILSKVGERIKWLHLLSIMGAILSMSVFAILIGIASLYLLGFAVGAMAGLAALIGLIGMLCAIPMMLNYLQNIELDTDLITDKTVKLIETCDTIATKVNTTFTDDIKTRVNSASENILSMVPVVLAITLLSWALKLVGQINLDKDKINENVKAVLGVANTIVQTVFAQDGYENPTVEEADKKWDWLKNIGAFVEEFFGNITAVVNAVLAVGFLAATFASTVILLFVGKLLTKIGEIKISEDINDKVTKIINLAIMIPKKVLAPADDDLNKTITKATETNTEGNFFTKVVDLIKDTNVGQGVSSLLGGAALILQNLSSSCVLVTVFPSIWLLGVVAEYIKTVLDIDTSKENDVKSKVDSIINIAGAICTSVNGKSDLGFNAAKWFGFGNFVDNSVKFYKGINDLKVENVRSLTELYTQLAALLDKLNAVNLKEIAKVLEEDIVPALDGIKEKLEITIKTEVTGSTGVTGATGPVGPIDYTQYLDNVESLLTDIYTKLGPSNVSQ